jgi:Tfp pilus assembly protein PilN
VKTLNLATRPFRNERLPTLLAAASLGAALALTGYHVLLARDVMPDRTSALTRKLAEMEEESARLRKEASEMRSGKTELADLAQWIEIKDLVDRRVFSWSGLFSVLEGTVPNGVRLVSVAPKVEKGKVSLRIEAVARTYDEARQFMTALIDRPEFSDVWPTRRTEEDGKTTYQFDMTYLPEARKAKAAPSPEASQETPSAPARVAARIDR